MIGHKALKKILSEILIFFGTTCGASSSGGGLKYKIGKKVVMSKVAKALGFERYVVLMLSLCGFNAFLVVLMWVLSVFMWF